VTSVAQSVCLRDILGIRAVKLFIEFVVVPSPVDTIFEFQAAYRSENLPLKYEQLVLHSFGQHPRLTAVEQLFLIPLCLLLFSMLSKYPERLTDSYRRYLYHRHMRVVMFLCCRLYWLFVGLLVIR
jgi:hypothetical protein